MSTLEKNLYKRVQSKQSQKDIRPQPNTIYRGISTVNPENNGFRLYDVSIIKQDIINHFHIRRGEKLENPEFGTVIWAALFEPMTATIKEIITNDIEKIIDSDPRVSVDQVIVDEFYNGIQIECVITYLDYSISEQMRLQFDQDNGLIA